MQTLRGVSAVAEAVWTEPSEFRETLEQAEEGQKAEAAGEVGQWVPQGPEAVDGVVEAMAEAAAAVAARRTADMSDWQVGREENSDKGT